MVNREHHDLNDVYHVLQSINRQNAALLDIATRSLAVLQSIDKKTPDLPVIGADGVQIILKENTP